MIRLPSSSTTIGLSIISSVAVLTALSASNVEAFNDNPCTKTWVANQNYSSFTCNVGDLTDWLIPKIIGPILSIVIGLLICACTFCTCVFRYCCGCCGSAKQRPGHFCCGGQHWDDLPPDDIKIAYDAKGVLATKALVGLTAILAIVAAAVSFAGAGQASKLPSVVASGAVDFSNWIIGGFDILLNGMDPNRSEFSAARTAIANAKTEAGKVRDSIETYGNNLGPFSTAVLGLAIPTVFIALCGIGAVVCMVLSIRLWVPAFLIFLTMMAAPPTGIMGGAAGLLTAITGLYCDEVSAQLARQPGVFQNYFIPTVCYNQLKIDTIRGDFTSSTDSINYKACDAIQQACSAGAALGGDGKVYQCDNAPTCTEGTTTVDDVKTLAGSLNVKTGVPGACTDATPSNPCTITRCATDCTDVDPYYIKTKSANVSSDITVVTNAVDAMNKVKNEYLDCNILTDHLLNIFDICSTLHPGMKNVGAGAGIGLTSCILLIIGLFLGQKRFFTKSAFNKEEAELTLMGRL